MHVKRFYRAEEDVAVLRGHHTVWCAGPETLQLGQRGQHRSCACVQVLSLRLNFLPASFRKGGGTASRRPTDAALRILLEVDVHRAVLLVLVLGLLEGGPLGDSLAAEIAPGTRSRRHNDPTLRH